MTRVTLPASVWAELPAPQQFEHPWCFDDVPVHREQFPARSMTRPDGRGCIEVTMHGDQDPGL